MEITTELLEKIYERASHVFLAKTGHEAETIELLDGEISCSYSYPIPYGGTETSSESITAEELVADLDELIKVRKEKEEIKKQEELKQYKEQQIRLEAEKKAKRKSEYQKLRKEFDEMSEISFAEWLNNNEWVKRNHTHPRHVGKYWSNIHCQYKTIEELYEMFKLIN